MGRARTYSAQLPTHYCVERAESSSIEANESKEVANFSAAVSAIERSHDFVVIDTPGNDTSDAPDLEKRILEALNKPGRTEGVRKIAVRFGVDASTVRANQSPFRRSKRNRVKPAR